MKRGKIYIGTSGWKYKHWRGIFYPDNIKNKDEFAWYHKHFDTVELNNSFYHLPSSKIVSSWKNAAPPKFLFSVKASRYITHMKKLKFEKASLRLFFSRIDKLENKLGPVLFQLPPRWHVNGERLSQFLVALPKGYRYTFEFRDHSWYDENIFNLLRKHHCAFCIYELERHVSPLAVTGNFVYIRLHGPGNKYQGNYNIGQLKKWAAKCNNWRKEGKDVFIYFDNDQNAYAVFNAIRLKELVGT